MVRIHPTFSWLCVFVHFSTIASYTFTSSIDNLLYISHRSTLYAISSSHLYQLYWSSTNRTLLLLHRRVPLHPSLDETNQGVSVFLYHPSRHALLLCARSKKGRCVLYDANDISRVYELDAAIETNYLGCVSGCYSFLAGHTIRSALSGYRLDRNGNIISSVLELDRDLAHFNIRYEYQSDDRTSLTALMFRSDRRSVPHYLYGFDHDDYTYYVIRSSRLARFCQSSMLMHLSYEEIPLIPCSPKYHNQSIIDRAFYSSDQLYLIYGDTLCRYVMDDIHRAFQRSKMECHQGHGYLLESLVDGTNGKRPQCEDVKEQSSDISPIYECHWRSYRTNLYVDGSIAAMGDIIYETVDDHVKLKFVFIHDDILIIGTSAGHIHKFIRTVSTAWHLLHTTAYTKYPLNPDYVIDYTRQSLIFAVGTELHRYAYNSCALYDTCRSCIASQPFEHQICHWVNGRCSSSTNSSVLYHGCPPSIDHIHPINASVNLEQVTLNITGSFNDIPVYSIKVLVTFPLPNHQNQYSCTIQEVVQNSLTCSLVIPKQPMLGTISMHIQPGRSLTLGDTDIMGSVEFNEPFQVYIPQPRLVPDYGPSAGGTKIQVTNMMLNMNDHVFSSMQIYLGNRLCPIVRSDPQTDVIECINQGCSNDRERLELTIFFDGRPWLLEKTYFQCRANPILFDWSPKKATISGGYQLWVNGQNLDVVQEPKMTLTSNSLNLTLTSPCTSLSTSRMNCSTPALSGKEGLDLPLQLNISFIMDYAQLVPEESNFTLLPDPIYERFDESIRRIDSTGLVHIRVMHSSSIHIVSFTLDLPQKGSNLISSHSMDQLNIHIDRVQNACLPLNLTDTDLLCALSTSAVQEFQHDQPYMEIHVGANLFYRIGQITFENGSQSVPLLVSMVPQSFGVWPIFILIILSLSSICTLFLSVLMITRRRFYQSIHHFDQTALPPFYLQSIWNEFDQQYRIQRKQLILSEKIGQGCVVDIYQAEWKQSRKKSLSIAVKILRDRTISSMFEYLTEINRMKSFSHRNVLSLLGITWDATREAMAIYPLMKNGDLRNFLSNQMHQPTMRQLLKWAIQVSDGMEYLSSMKFVHQDLAARNCLLDEEFVCRIADFSVTRDLLDRDYYNLPISAKDAGDTSTQNRTRRVPIRWLSPEAIESAQYTTQSDIWSFGVFVWELFSRGKTPYSTIDNTDIYKSIQNGYRLPSPNYCPALLYDSVMSLCWHADPLERPSFTQLSHDIRHILHQLEFDQQQQMSSADDDTTIIQRYPVDQATPLPIVIDENEHDRADLSRSSTDMFNTATLLPEYTETIIAQTSQ